MSDVDVDALGALLDEVRRELASTIDDLDRSRAAHRSVESLLLVVLDHVPTPVVVVDAELRVRALSAAAERSWGASLNDVLSSIGPVEESGLGEVIRSAVETRQLPASAVPDGYGAALMEEPGTGAIYVIVWQA